MLPADIVVRFEPPPVFIMQVQTPNRLHQLLIWINSIARNFCNAERSRIARH